MSGKPLYEITAEYENLLWMMEENELLEQELITLLEDVADQFDKKATNITGLFLNMEAESKNIKEAEAKMKKRRDSLDRKSKSLREYLLNSMIMLEIQTVKTDQFHVKIRNNPPKVSIVSEALLPDEFKEEVSTIHLDKNAIKEAIKAGNPVAGAILTQDQRLHVS
jgi:hypothetical protein